MIIQHECCNLSNCIVSNVFTKSMIFKMLSAKLMCIASFTLATGVVIRSSVWYAGSNKCLRKRPSSGFDLDSVKLETQINSKE